MIVPIPTTPGLTSNLVGVDLPIASVVGRIEAVELRRTDLSAGALDTVELRTAPGGGGSAITVTFGDGEEFAQGTGGPIDATGLVYLRVTSATPGAGGLTAQNLGGNLTVQASAAVQGQLTTLARVKTFLNISDTSKDAFLQSLIESVSGAMESHMLRRIVAVSKTERHSGRSYPDLILRGRVADPGTLTLTEDGTALVLDTDFWLVAEPKGRSRLTRIASGVAIGWRWGTYNVVAQYEDGFAATPPELSQVADEEVAHRFFKSPQSGIANLELESKALESGGQTSYVGGGWLKHSVEVMNLYRLVF